MLLVTDEEPQPLGAIRGTIENLRRLVAESPFFEYIVTDDDASFGIIDTHDNALVEINEG